ncbi:MAG: DUF3568 family protein [Desulfobacterales bacterium]|jgi:hypothetical protein|nr:MAG: DUF3568 family protein [Desulfobacterales bacterium]
MKNKISILAILFCLIITLGCAVILIGAGAGAGAYAYLNGELKRAYEARYDRTVKACTDALKSLKITINEKTSDSIKTVLNAKRSDGTKVTVKAVKLDQNVTEVSVRTGVVGLWDKETSMQIHESIKKRL